MGAILASCKLIRIKKFRKFSRGMSNPGLRNSEFHERLEFAIQVSLPKNPESTARNPESKTGLDSTVIGGQSVANFLV